MPRPGEQYQYNGQVVRLDRTHAADPAIWIALDDRGASVYIGTEHLETLRPVADGAVPAAEAAVPPVVAVAPAPRRTRRRRSQRTQTEPAEQQACPACGSTYTGALGTDHACAGIAAVRCRGCERTEAALLANPPRQPYLCSTCIQRSMFICKSCNRAQASSRYPGTCDRCNPMLANNVWTRVGGVARGNDIIIESRSHRPFGVEIECFLDPDEAVTHGEPPEGWDKGVDGSIRPDAGCHDPSEFRSPPLRGDEGLRLLHAGVKRLRELGYRANASAGLHAHICLLGTEADDREALHRFGTWIQSDIFKMVAPSRAESRYCKKLTTYARDRGDKYLWMSLQAYERHRTCEFRIHHGVTRAESVVEYVRLCLRIVERGLMLGHRTQKPTGGIFDLLGLTPFERDYWTATAKRLHGENVTWEVT